jgi:hypothetical protein
MADKEEKNVMAMCMPYNTPSVSNSLMEENMILMAEAKARLEAEAKAKAEAEANSKPQMRSIDPYDDEKKEKRNDKKLEKLKKLYGF